ncbi:MAG: SusC/RagA family TonB-linked outer membrane protein, partial [Segetibacter sp.]|nr:SusC/RagA family TonB-linked outer membrane protein [Segetibacter sp.]
AVRYAISGEYFNQDGIILNSNFKRYSVRANFDAQLTKRLAIRMNINPSYIVNNNVIAQGGGAGASTSIIGSATSAQPYYPLYNPDGSYFIYQTVDASTDLYNPIALALEKKDVSTRTRILGNVNAEYKIFEGLKLNVLLGATSNNTKGSSFWPQLPVFLGRSADGSDFASSGYNWLAEYTANYNRTFGKHSIAALAGYTVQEDVVDDNTISSNNFPNNLVPTLSAVSGIITTGTATRAEWSIVSQLARVNYSYDGKYLVTASIRRDGSSRFGANNKYGVFPSAALAWRVSDESFMMNVPLISLLKLRVSYGKTGNNNIGNYASLSTINYIKYTTGGVAVGGFAPGAIPNPNLTWETQEQVNAGLDLGLLKGRVNITADRFVSRNKDLLLNVNVPTASGFSTALQNIGEVKNTGWEFVLNSINTIGKFKWSTDFNISAYKNEVVRLGPSGDPIIVGNNITRIGQPIGMFYGYIVDGIFKNAAELAAGPIYNKGLADETKAGDIRFRDVSGPGGKPDGIINNNDLTIMGTPYPDFYYGMTNRFSYGNVSLSVNLAGSHGNQIYSNAMVIYRLIRSRSRTLATELNYWKSEADPGDGNTVRPHDNPRGGLRLPSTRYMDNGSFLRINNITLGYNLPNKISSALSLGSLRVYATANNAFVFTKNLSFNPDVSNSGNALTPGIDANNYPLPRSVVFGLNVGF